MTRRFLLVLLLLAFSACTTVEDPEWLVTYEETVSNCPVEPPVDETCNGADDDCDSFIDEGVLNACGTCGDVPEDTTCDGEDDDCDGATDEAFEPEAITCGDGACSAPGTRTCLEGAPFDEAVPSAGVGRGRVRRCCRLGSNGPTNITGRQNEAENQESFKHESLAEARCRDIEPRHQPRPAPGDPRSGFRGR